MWVGRSYILNVSFIVATPIMLTTSAEKSIFSTTQHAETCNRQQEILNGQAQALWKCWAWSPYPTSLKWGKEQSFWLRDDQLAFLCLVLEFRSFNVGFFRFDSPTSSVGVFSTYSTKLFEGTTSTRSLFYCIQSHLEATHFLPYTTFFLIVISWRFA